jgi:hypothetical protein
VGLCFDVCVCVCGGGGQAPNTPVTYPSNLPPVSLPPVSARVLSRGFRERKQYRLHKCKASGPSSPAEWDRLRSPAVSFVTRKWNGWEERKMPAKNVCFYYNTGSGESSWDQPAAWCVRGGGTMGEHQVVHYGAQD